MCWRNAREHSDLLTIDRLRPQVNTIIHRLNTTPHIGETLSPYDKWRLTPGPRYNAPPPNRFIHLLDDAHESRQTIIKRGIQYNKDSKHSKPLYFVPRDPSPAADMRWFSAVGRDEKVLFQVHKMKEFGTFYYARLDGEHWEEVISDTKHGRSLDQRMDNRLDTLNTYRHGVNEIRAETTAVQKERHGMLPQRDPITEEAVYEKPKLQRKPKASPKKAAPDAVSAIEEYLEHHTAEPDGVEKQEIPRPDHAESALVDRADVEQEPAAPREIDAAKAQALEDMFEQLKRKFASQ